MNFVVTSTESCLSNKSKAIFSVVELHTIVHFHRPFTFNKNRKSIHSMDRFTSVIKVKLLLWKIRSVFLCL